MELSEQVAYLFLLSLPIACIAWTVTHEEIFKETRDFFLKEFKTSKTMLERKFYYLFTCEYCFSHYVAIVLLILTRYYLLFDDWRGYLIAGFSLVWIANIYMSLFGFVRVGMKKGKMEADIEEIKLKQVEKSNEIFDLEIYKLLI